MNSDFPTPGLKHLLRGAPRDTRTPTDSHTAHAHTHTPSADLGRHTDPLQCTHNREHNTYMLLHHHTLTPKHNHAHAHKQQPSQDPYTGACTCAPHPCSSPTRAPQSQAQAQCSPQSAAGVVGGGGRACLPTPNAGACLRLGVSVWVCVRWCGCAVLYTCVLGVCLSMFLHRCVPLHQAPGGRGSSWEGQADQVSHWAGGWPDCCVSAVAGSAGEGAHWQREGGSLPDLPTLRVGRLHIPVSV